MVIFILSPCENFTLAYKTFLEKNCQNLVVFGFESLEMLTSRQTVGPSYILLKSHNSEFETQVKQLRHVFPFSKIMVALLPKFFTRLGNQKLMADLYFSVNEPLQFTLDKILQKFENISKLRSKKISQLKTEVQEMLMIYNQLSPKLSLCLYYIFTGLSASEISNKLNLSSRTIEGYFVKLQKEFKVHGKNELKNVYSVINNIDKYFDKKILLQ